MDKQTGKLIARIAENLPDMESGIMQGWIDNPKGLQIVLKGALCPPKDVPNFKTFRTIKLGTGLKTADDFRKSLKKANCSIGSWGDNILGKAAFTVATEEAEVGLVVVSVAELGFKNGATRADIYKRAQGFGLSICPNEVGPQLRLQYKEDQPEGERLLIGMEHITDSDGYSNVFSVLRYDDGKQWLDGYYGYPDFFWIADNLWVFLRRK